MSMEATSGKNPVNHIGKIYNLLATDIAETVVDEVEGIREIRIRLLSQIGQPIHRPHVADASLVTDAGIEVGDIEPAVEGIIDRELADVTSITERVIDGELSTF
jgi:S-adenosylmethionine synthetase